MENKIIKQDYLKVCLMLIIVVLYAWYQDVLGMIEDRDYDAPAYYLTVGVLLSGFIWYIIKSKKLKKAVLVCYIIIYFPILIYLLYCLHFNLAYYETKAILALFVLMSIIFLLAYKFGMKNRKKRK